MKRSIKFARKISEQEDLPIQSAQEESVLGTDQVVDIKTRQFSSKEREEMFFKRAETKLAKRGIGDQKLVDMQKKSSLVQQINKTISDVSLQESQLKIQLKIGVKTKGCGGKLFDATEFVKNMAKDDKEPRPLQQPKKSSKKKPRRKQSRQELFTDLRRKTQTNKSTNITSQQIRSTFLVTSLSQLKSNRQTGNSKGFKEEQPRSQQHSRLSSDNYDTQPQTPGCHVPETQLPGQSDQFKVEQSKSKLVPIPQIKNKKPPKKKQTKSKKPKSRKRCQFIDQEAEQSGDDVNNSQSDQSQDQDFSDLQGLIDNDIQINEKNQLRGRRKMMEVEAQRDQAMMQRILKGEFFKKKPLRNDPPSKEQMDKRKKWLGDLALQQLGNTSLEKPLNSSNKDVLQKKMHNKIEDQSELGLEEQKEQYLAEVFFKQHSQKTMAAPTKEVPGLLLRRKTQVEMRTYNQNGRRGSMIPKDPVKRQRPSNALDTWLNHMKGYLVTQTVGDSQSPNSNA